ncbi:DNA circularization protein [Sphingopyxis alaskensis]|uniref:DNA circularization protein n=1 Tax=Sphingopyxis alaskensis TaxID=117207 RepID=UPI0020421164|nr:DNA circularization N-terminal domain-containing protein [Sphingopyxis alaskensis]MCM3419060.1 DNA circularization N-terminal domain-containing protein [Sphingopyxis alaskensis]
MAIQPQQAPVAAPTTTATGWRERYVRGSFRGVGFVSEQREQSGGRRVALFELPFRDTPIGEDLGRRAGEWQIDCFVHGTDYMDRRDALIDALEAFGPGTYVDPWTGQQHQAYCEDYRFVESTDEGGMARFTILFRESGAERPLTATTDTAALAQSTATSLSADLPGDFAQRFSIDKAAGFVEDAAADLVATVATAAELSAATSGGLGQALRSFESGLRLLPSGTAALLRAPLSLGQTLVGLVGAVSALSAQPRARLRAVEPLARFGGDIDAVVGTTPARRRQAANQDAIIHLVRAAAGAELVKAAAQIRWTNQSDATMTRNRIAAIFDAHALSAADAGEDARADQFDRLRTALARDIGARSAGLARGYRYTPRATEPALTIAQRLHGFGPAMEAQADALVAMNRVRHPGFVRGGSALDIVGSEPRNG